jgi:hypothetical protein
MSQRSIQRSSQRTDTGIVLLRTVPIMVVNQPMAQWPVEMAQDNQA